MNEEKYYVRLVEAFHPGRKYPVQLGFNGSDYYFDRYKCSAAENYNQNSFTKSELSEIMDGAIYKCHEVTAEWNEFEHPDWEYSYDIDKYEWINSLIELVPMEDGE